MKQTINKREMDFNNIDSNDNSNSILIIVLIEISIIILTIITNKDWNNKSFEKKWKFLKK